MTWHAIARKDIADASRSVMIWLLLGVLVLVFVGFGAIDAWLGEGSFERFLEGLAEIVVVFVPLLALVLGYKSVIHERVSGSIVLLLSFPHARLDVVLGKFVGRSVVLLAPIFLALIAAGVAGAILYGSRAIVWYPWFLAVTGLYGLVFLSIALGLSMSSTRDRRVTFGALGAYLLLVTLWDGLVDLSVVILYRFAMGIEVPAWAYLAHLLQPSEAYYRLLRVAFDLEQGGQSLEPTAPWFVDWWMALLVLCAWIVVPMALGFWRFRETDL